EPAAADGLAQMVSDLLVNRPIAGRINMLRKNRSATHGIALTPALVYYCCQQAYSRDHRMSNESARHSVSVTGIITDNCVRVLLIQRRDNHHWEPPGGVLELGESIEDGLHREVFGETGLNVEPIALTGVYKNMNLGIVALVFRCKTVGGEARTSDETEEFYWA